MYLAIRTPATPQPEFVFWLTVITMLLSGVLAWLAESRRLMLTRLATTEALLVLLAGSPVEGIATAFAVGLILRPGSVVGYASPGQTPTHRKGPGCGPISRPLGPR